MQVTEGGRTRGSGSTAGACDRQKTPADPGSINWGPATRLRARINLKLDPAGGNPVPATPRPSREYSLGCTVMDPSVSICLSLTGIFQKDNTLRDIIIAAITKTWPSSVVGTPHQQNRFHFKAL